jgi:hypothetical protein
MELLPSSLLLAERTAGLMFWEEFRSSPCILQNDRSWRNGDQIRIDPTPLLNVATRAYTCEIEPAILRG